MRRRDFIKVIGSGAVAWPLFARAQQFERMRRIGVLMAFAKDNPEGLARIAAFVKELQRLGWTDGRNIQIEYRWDTGDLRKVTTELVALSPDAILASSTPQWPHCNRRLARCRSYLRRLSIRSAPALSPACRSPAAT